MKQKYNASEQKKFQLYREVNAHQVDIDYTTFVKTADEKQTLKRKKKEWKESQKQLEIN